MALKHSPNRMTMIFFEIQELHFAQLSLKISFLDKIFQVLLRVELSNGLFAFQIDKLSVDESLKLSLVGVKSDENPIMRHHGDADWRRKSESRIYLAVVSNLELLHLLRFSILNLLFCSP